MTLSATEAQTALDEIERATVLTRHSGAYRRVAPYLQLWGLIWALGYAEPVLLPGVPEGLAWMILDLCGAVGSIVLAWRTGRSENDQRRGDQRMKRMAAGGLLVLLFMAATYAVLPPTDVAQTRVYPALILGFVYGLTGIFLLPRFLWIAAVVPAAGLSAYFLLPSSLPLVMATAGGGSIFLGGLWMRKL
jgi:hypothetical protein